MNKKNPIYFIVFFFTVHLLFSQTDFSSSWEDFFSYNNVKDFVEIDRKIYAIADNAAFIHDLEAGTTEKISSVHGLSGKETTSLYYSAATKRFVIGYQTGLIEIIDETGKIIIANDIERLDITGQKQINHISEYSGYLYLSTPFGIVTYDLINLNFGDTYYIDIDSNPIFVYETSILDDAIFAVTPKGIYSADLNNPNLIDYNNWLQPEGNLEGNFLSISSYNNKLYTCKSNALFELVSIDQLDLITSFNKSILKVRSSEDFLTVSLNDEAIVLDENVAEVYRALPNEMHNFSLHTALSVRSQIFLATKSFGILNQTFNAQTYEEIHPEGPTSNQVFSIQAGNNNLWVVYGGHDLAYAPMGKRYGFSHYNGSAYDQDLWVNKPFDPAFPAKDLVHVTPDPNQADKVYISSWGSGMMVVENDQPSVLWDDTNSGLENLYPDGAGLKSIRINGSAFDNRGNFWIANAWVQNRVKKYESNGTWKSFDLSSIMTNPALGLNELVIDKTGSIWIGSRRNGALVYNESGDRKRALLTEATKGSLPDLNVRTIAVDRNNRIWIGTLKGLVVFNDAQGLFEATIYDAQPVIVEDNGVAKKLLGDQPVNSIAIDGAENKWFGTDTGGVLGTNPSGNETLYIFNKDNSPLPSNRILKIQVDDSNGNVFFATDKGIVAFNSEVAPFGDALGEVYAYPNPAKKEHEIITIDGRNGTHLPKGTNVKILDIAGRLVYETNVDIGQEIRGGKVIWNKTNLRGTKVASGIYIVLLTSPDNSETSSTKIAIIN